MDKKRRAICNVHFEIDDLIHDIRQLKPILSYDTLKDYETKLNEILVKMKILVIEATEAGQAMEDRLKEYRLAIEDLGFARDKEHKIKDEIADLKERVFELENLEECNTCEFGNEGTCNNCKGIEGSTTEIVGKSKCDNYKRTKK